MKNIHAPPREGDLYKIITIDEHSFELRFGYYSDSERDQCEPVVIYPSLKEPCLYTNEGYLIVTAVQEPCKHYTPPNGQIKEESCIDCIHYHPPTEDIGVCKCAFNHQNSAEGGNEI